MKKIYLLFILFLSTSLMSLEPVILVFGPPGSGKGTFSQMAKEKGYDHLSAGDMIRDEIAQKTPYGLMVEEIVKRGDYVDPHLFGQMVKAKITQMSLEKKPFIIDGFGRTLNDMQLLADTLEELNLNSVTFVLFFNAEDEICAKRISGRLVCTDCHQVYNTKNSVVQAGDTCQNCLRGTLQERMNDTYAVIQKRLLQYREKIEPVYKTSLKLFPHILFDSGQESSICLEFYERLLFDLRAHEGTLSSFTDQFSPEKSSN